MNLPERTPDGYAQIWLLYSPEPFEFDSDDDRSIHLWVHRASVFTSQAAAMGHPERLTGYPVEWRQYGPFPELWIGFDSRGSRWLCEAAPVDPLVGRIG